MSMSLLSQRFRVHGFFVELWIFSTPYLQSLALPQTVPPDYDQAAFCRSQLFVHYDMDKISNSIDNKQCTSY